MFSIFHYLAISEIHGILLALFKEIERVIKFKENEENKDIKTIEYFLTSSNFHDSSQINFNYASSLLTLYLLKLINNKYSIIILYSICIVIISSLSYLLMAIDYEESYDKWKLIFSFIFPYIIIYCFTGFISLLPNKILNDIYKNEKKVSKFGQLIFINFFLGFSVTLKNFFNKYIIVNFFSFNISLISNWILSETLIFDICSIIYLIFMSFFIYCINKRDKKDKEKKNITNKEMIEQKSINENNDNNNDNIDKDNDLNSKNDNKNEDKTNNKNNNIDNNQNSIDYIGGYLVIQTNMIKSLITFKGFWNYILSVLINKKIGLILLINLCSRIQKLKFKTEYKKRITNDVCLFLNFLLSFLLYIILYSIIYLISYKKCLCNNNKRQNEEDKKEEENKDIEKENKDYEKIIIIIFLIEFIFIFITSFIFVFINDSDYLVIDIIIYIFIALTGSLNFFFYYYYSIQQEEYITLSGIISLSQLIFRLIEFIFEPFNNKLDYIWQICSSFFGIFFAILYLKLLSKESEEDNVKLEFLN